MKLFSLLIFPYFKYLYSNFRPKFELILTHFVPTGFFEFDIWDECKVILEPLIISIQSNVMQEENGFKCKKCGKSYKVSKTFERHQTVCKKGGKNRFKNTQEFRCSGCERTFFSMQQLTRHRVSGRSKNCAYNEVSKKTRRGTQYNAEE